MPSHAAGFSKNGTEADFSLIVTADRIGRTALVDTLNVLFRPNAPVEINAISLRVFLQDWEREMRESTSTGKLER